MESLAPFLLYVVIPVITGILAMRKGYNFFLWLFAAGIIGLIILAFLPFANKPELAAEDSKRLRTKGNITGGVISALVILLWVAQAASRSSY